MATKTKATSGKATKPAEAKAATGQEWRAAADAAKAKAAKSADERRNEVFRLRLETIDGLMRVAAELAGKMLNDGTPPLEDDIERELWAVDSALPVLADALTCRGVGRYDFESYRPDVTLSQHLDHLTTMLKLAELTAARREGRS